MCTADANAIVLWARKIGDLIQCMWCVCNNFSEPLSLFFFIRTALGPLNWPSTTQHNTKKCNYFNLVLNSCKWISVLSTFCRFAYLQRPIWKHFFYTSIPKVRNYSPIQIDRVGASKRTINRRTNKQAVTYFAFRKIREMRKLHGSHNKTEKYKRIQNTNAKGVKTENGNIKWNRWCLMWNAIKTAEIPFKWVTGISWKLMLLTNRCKSEICWRSAARNTCVNGKIPMLSLSLTLLYHSNSRLRFNVSSQYIYTQLVHQTTIVRILFAFKWMHGHLHWIVSGEQLLKWKAPKITIDTHIRHRHKVCHCTFIIRKFPIAHIVFGTDITSQQRYGTVNALLGNEKNGKN